MIEKTCCFIMNKPERLAWRSNKNSSHWMRIKELLSWQIKQSFAQYGINHYISVLDRGIDTGVVNILLRIKRVYPITLEFVIPTEKQAAHWSKHDRECYYLILRQADRRTIFQSRLMQNTYQNCYRYMIDQSNYVYAIWNGVSDEITNAIHYARQMNRYIYIIDPGYSLIVPDWG